MEYGLGGNPLLLTPYSLLFLYQSGKVDFLGLRVSRVTILVNEKTVRQFSGK